VSERRKEYWRKNLTISAILLFAWVALTCVIGYYARELRDIPALGVLYVVILGLYAWYVRRQDHVYRE
jgi:uncharacterized membrane protein